MSVSERKKLKQSYSVASVSNNYERSQLPDYKVDLEERFREIGRIAKLN